MDQHPFQEKPMWIRPPHVALAYSLAAWGLHRWVPGCRVFTFTAPLFGMSLILAGLLHIFPALRAFKRRDTTHDPHGMPTALVEDWPFSQTRNPMYLGVTLVLSGVACLAGTLPFFLVPVLFALTMNRVFIPREERRLTHLFGQAYINYCARVRRWI